MFRGILGGQAEPGTLVELGCYLGKSAVVIGDYIRPGEEFVVVDLFGRLDLVEGDQSTSAEAGIYASRLSLEQFEANYRSVHEQLPTVVVGPSQDITRHVDPGAARFIHIDASHQYEHVVTDIENALLLIQPGGVIVFDDYRSIHTPGVSAAVWGAVERGEIIPVAHTDQKLYCVTTAPEELTSLVDTVVEHEDLTGYSQSVAGHALMRIAYSPAHAERRAAQEAAAAREAESTATEAVVRARDEARDEARAEAAAQREAYAAEWARQHYGAEPGMSPLRLAARLVARGYLPRAGKRVIAGLRRSGRG